MPKMIDIETHTAAPRPAAPPVGSYMKAPGDFGEDNLRGMYIQIFGEEPEYVFPFLNQLWAGPIPAPPERDDR